MENNYIVSICIPTCNRCACLKKSIESLIQQPEFKNGNMEIVISDNASIDETEKLGKTYALSYKNIIYSRLNTGIDSHNNFIRALKLGHGKLRKLSNDTLVYKENSLNLFSELVRKYEIDKPLLFFLNQDSQYEVIETRDFTDFIHTASFYITWIAGFTIWEDDCYILDDDTPGTGSELWQTEVICSLYSQKRHGIVIKGIFSKAILVDKKNLSYGLFRVFYTNLINIVRKYSMACLPALKKDLLYHFFYQWMLEWEFKNPHFIFSNKENLKELVFCQYKDESYFDDFKRKYLVSYCNKKNALISLKSFCRQYNNVYLYGIGFGAEYLYPYLIRWEINVIGCIVSNGEKKCNEWKHKPVFEIEDVKMDLVSTGIIVTVNQKLQDDIFTLLRKYGYTDNVFLQQVFATI